MTAPLAASLPTPSNSRQLVFSSKVLAGTPPISKVGAMQLPPAPTAAAQLRQMQRRLPSPQTHPQLRVPLLVLLLVLVTDTVIHGYSFFLLKV